MSFSLFLVYFSLRSLLLCRCCLLDFHRPQYSSIFFLFLIYSSLFSSGAMPFLFSPPTIFISVSSLPLLLSRTNPSFLHSFFTFLLIYTSFSFTDVDVVLMFFFSPLFISLFSSSQLLSLRTHPPILHSLLTSSLPTSAFIPLMIMMM